MKRIAYYTFSLSNEIELENVLKNENVKYVKNTQFNTFTIDSEAMSRKDFIDLVNKITGIHSLWLIKTDRREYGIFLDLIVNETTKEKCITLLYDWMNTHNVEL